MTCACFLPLAHAAHVVLVEGRPLLLCFAAGCDGGLVGLVRRLHDSHDRGFFRGGPVHDPSDR